MSSKTLKMLEDLSGGGWSSESSPSSLTDWYLSVREVPLEELSIGDLCRAIRQRLFITSLLPIASKSVSNDVMAGDLYDGELLVALSALHKDEWLADLSSAGNILAEISSADLSGQDVQLIQDISRLKETLRAVIG